MCAKKRCTLFLLKKNYFMSQNAITIESLEENLKVLARQRAIYSVLFIGAIIFIVVSGVGVANQYNAGSFTRGVENFFDYPADLFSDAFEAGWGWFGIVLSFIPALFETFSAAVFSTVVGASIALILCPLATINLSPNQVTVQIVRRTFDILRSFPELVFALILLYLMGKSIVPAIIAVTLHTIGAMGKLFSEAIENIDMKPVDGLKSVGARWYQIICFAVYPQVLPLVLSYSLLRLEINVRASTILGFVGAGGIGAYLTASLQWRYGDEVLAIMFLLVATITALDYFSSYVRHKLIGKISA